MTRPAGAATLILLLITSSTSILQVLAICLCDEISENCFDCPCDDGGCEEIPQQCKRRVLDAFACQSVTNCGDAPQCFSDNEDNYYWCECDKDSDECAHLGDCVSSGDPRCCSLLQDFVLCNEVENCSSGNDVVTIAVTVSVVVVMLIVIASITLICYWRYKFKLTREKLSHTAPRDVCYNISYNVAQHSQVHSNDPLYSVLDDETQGHHSRTQAFPAVSPQPPQLPTSQHSQAHSDNPLYSVLDDETQGHHSRTQAFPAVSPQPPQLPTSQRPYYEEIDSDFKGTSPSVATPSEPGQPVQATLTKTIPKLLNGSSISMNEECDYQEPADALKVVPQEEVKKQMKSTADEISAYHEPLDALRADSSLPLQEEKKITTTANFDI